MEERVGKLWNQLISRGASHRHPEAMVLLDDVKTTVGILFRALGGDGGLSVEAVPDSPHLGHRTWLQRLAGAGMKTPWYWQDERALRLPASLDLFPESALNRDLFLWLAALASKNEPSSGDWFIQAIPGSYWKSFPALIPATGDWSRPTCYNGPNQHISPRMRLQLSGPYVPPCTNREVSTLYQQQNTNPGQPPFGPTLPHPS